jgi:dUTP pyrophosphatase
MENNIMSIIQSFRYNRTIINVDDISPDMSIELDIGGDKSFWKRVKMACQFMTRGFYVSTNFNFIGDDFDKFVELVKKKKYNKSSKVFNVQKVFKDAFIPMRARESDAGWDIRCPFDTILQPQSMALIDFGIRIEIADGYEIQARSRSGVATKYQTMMALGVGTIDSGYRGSIRCPMYNFGDSPIQFKRGNRIAQLVIKKTENIKLAEGNVNMNTDRGENGFGSSGL